MDTDKIKRICVIGCGGAGKSTFSKLLAEKTGIPLIHLDSVYWLPGWIEPTKDEFEQKLENIINKKTWILDGNFHNTMTKRFHKSDMIFWLDYPTWQCLYGVFKRLVTDYGKTREDMAQDCKESFDWKFLKYVFSFRKNTRPKILNHIKHNAKHCRVAVFKNPKELQKWIDKNLC